MRKKLKKAAYLVGIVLCAGSLIQALASGAQISVEDVSKNESVEINSDNLTAGARVIFTVFKPDGSEVGLFDEADNAGRARVVLGSEHTSNTGSYSVTLQKIGQSQILKTASFKVLSVKSISAVNSKISAEPAVVRADGSEKSLIKVSLRDQNGSSVSGAEVVLISSRLNDQVEYASSTKTNQNGNIFFYASSFEPGIGYFSALVKESGAILEDRERVVFIESEFTNTEDFLNANLASEDINASIFGNSETSGLFGPIDYFELEFPETVGINSDQNFLTITAKDAQDRTVKSYTGTVIISTDDDDASLPGGGRYTFQPEDQGSHTFDLALRFSELGTRTITVYDFDNESGEISTNIKGEKTVEVVSEDPGGESGTTSELQIVKPQNNSMQGGSTIVVVGKGFANSNLKLFLDDEFASLIEVDTDGLFTTEITSVSDGEHTLFVQEAEGAMRSSEIVTFRVDSNSPELEDLELFPESGVKAGESFTATVFSEGDLDRVGFRAAGISENLPEDTFESGRYELTMTAPQDPGEYPISIELVDELQNKSEISAAGILKVLPAGNLDLPAATNFQAEAKDRSVLLTWNFDEIGSDVAGFQILAGRSASSLSRVSEVAVSTREFTVSGLENDQEYYFALTSLDGVENEGSQTPVITARPEGNGNPTTPPIVKDPSEHGSSLVFEATAGSRRVYLRWDGHGEAESYAVKISVNGVNFAENIILPSSARTAEITDLINGQKYYFELIPLDASGNSLGDSYPTVSITPTWDGTHPTAAPLFIENYRPDTNSEQGPATWGLLILGTMLIGGYLFKRYFVYFRGY